MMTTRLWKHFVMGALIIFTAPLFLTCGLTAPGADYYIDSVSGSDDNSGKSVEKSLCSFQHDFPTR
jgi:hypothetical protein